MRMVSLLIAATAWLALAACGTISGPPPVDVSRVEIGTPRAEIERLFGTPVSLSEDARGQTYLYRFNRGCIPVENARPDATVATPIVIVAPLGPVVVFYHVGNVNIPVWFDSLGSRAEMEEILEATVEITYDDQEQVSAIGDLPKYIPTCEQARLAAKNRKMMNQMFHNIRKVYLENLRKHGPLACEDQKLSQYMIAQYFRDGHGVARDYAQSYKWFSLAARDGDEAISAYRDELAAKMTPGQIALGEQMVVDWQPNAKDCPKELARLVR